MAGERPPGYAAALDEARQGAAEGGIPIGSALVLDGRIVGRGHNRRIQTGDPTAHAEIDCLRNAGRGIDYRRATLCTTLFPCHLCSGAVVLFGIPTVVVGERRTFDGAGSGEWLRRHGVELVQLDDPEAEALLAGFIRRAPEVWAEDIGGRG